MYVFCPVSKEDRVGAICVTISRIKTDEKKNVLIVLDNPDISIDSIRIKCDSIRIIRSSMEPVPDARFGIVDRRRRVANTWRTAQRYFRKAKIDAGERLLMIEDDGEFEPDWYIKLRELFDKKNKKNKCGFVSGVEAGRWRYKIIGAWIKEKKNLSTVPFRKFGIAPVTSAGTYLTLTKIDRFLSYKVKSDIYFGHDVYFGMHLAKKGYENFIDYSLRVKHINGGKVLEVDRHCVELTFTYTHSTWIITKIR